MKVKLTQNRTFKRMLVNILSVFVILAMAFPDTTVAAANDSPFTGQWRGTDPDGSEIRLTIAGRPEGPFQITWTESYIGFCDGEAGIVRGTGGLNQGDPNRLEADVHLACFTTAATLDFHITWRYHAATNTLSSRYDNGVVTIWHRPGGGQPEEPPGLDLRVNYGHDWVESFYEGGHTAWVTVTDADGNVRATTELVTEPKWYWGDETGFQSFDGIWFDAGGNQMDNPPDILPNDWVYGWVDNGASAQVQIGDVSGTIDLANDSISGTIYAPWFSDAVQVECFDWGSGQEPPFDNKDAGFIATNGADPYSCTWEEWDIQPYQNVGVGYYGPDGHWVANAFFARNPRIVASEVGDWFWTTEFNPGTLNIFIYGSADEGGALLWSGQSEADQSGFTIVGYDVHGQDLVPGNYLVVSDGVNEKGVVLEMITMEVFDTENEIMAGTAPAGRDVTVVAGMAEAETQATINLTADAESGAWSADFSTIPFDITEDMRPWSFAQIFDEDGDANEAGTPPPPPNPRFVVFPEWEWFDGNDWPDGATVNITVEGKDECTTSKVSEGFFFNGSFGEGCDVVIGDEVTFTDGTTTRSHIVRNLAITDVDKAANTVEGTADNGATVYAWVHGFGETNMQLTVENGTWLADFGSNGFDVMEGMGGRAEVRDEFGNSTAVDWWIPIPVIFAHPAYELIEGADWTPGAEVTVSVDDPSNGEGVDYSDTQVVGDDKWLHFWLTNFDLQAGHSITMTDGQYMQTMVVSNLRVTGFNLDAHSLHGIGDPNSEFYIADNGIPVSIDGDGNWTATFDALTPGTWWTIIQAYPDGNEMRETFRAPMPMMIAWKNWDDVAGSEWTPGAEVTLTIDDPANGQGVDYTFTEVAADSGNLYYGEVYFDLGIELQTGYVLSMSDGNFTKTLVLSALTVTGYDFDNHIMYGTGDPGAQLLVHIGNSDSELITVGDDHHWSVYHELLEPYVWFDAIQSDDDGDQTRDGGQAL